MADQKRQPLTDLRIEKTELPASGNHDMWDGDTRGLVCRLTPGGKNFYLIKWAEGATRFIKIGPAPETSVKAARARALELLAAINRGEKPWEAKRLLRDESTLTDLWDHHTTHAKGRKRDSTLYLYKRAWAHLAALHNRKVGSVTRADIQREVNRIGKKHPVMANRAHSLIGVLYSTGIEAGLWKGSNPAIGVVRFAEKSRDRYLRPDELKAWWMALEYEPEAWRLYFVAAVLCGARKSNISGMRWADVDLNRGIWRVPGEQSKNGEPLIVVLAAPLMALMEDWRAKNKSPTWVFPTLDKTSKVPHIQDPKKPWKRVVARASLFRLVAALGEANKWDMEKEMEARAVALVEADHLRVRALGRREKIESEPLTLAVESYTKKVRDTGRDPADYLMDDVRIHDLRRTLGSWAAITGASLPIVGRALGHRSLAATQVYARLSIDPVRDAVETAGQSIIGHGGEAAARILNNDREATPASQPKTAGQARPARQTRSPRR